MFFFSKTTKTKVPLSTSRDRWYFCPKLFSTFRYINEICDRVRISSYIVSGPPKVNRIAAGSNYHNLKFDASTTSYLVYTDPPYQASMILMNNCEMTMCVFFELRIRYKFSWFIATLIGINNEKDFNDTTDSQ